MKKFKILLSFLLILGITSCSNFLNVTPKNVISMDDMESVKKALAGYLNNVGNSRSAYTSNKMPWSPFRFYTYSDLRLYTDEWDIRKFEEEKEITDGHVRIADWRTTSNQNLWSTLYSPIGLMNLIIHEGATAEGDEDVRDYVTGEAYVTRAYCFFKLLQHFSTYKDNAMGIPVCLNSYEDFEDVSVRRNTQKEVYSQIISDLHEAERRLERTKTQLDYNLMYTISVVNRLLAEVYHFKALSGGAEADDWKNAALYAGKETKGKTLVSDPVVLKSLLRHDLRTAGADEECAFQTYDEQSYAGVIKGLRCDQAFFLKYFPEGEGDIRRELFYIIKKKETDGVIVYDLQFDKHSSYSGSYVQTSKYRHLGFRLAEAFLIQAEALAMSDQLPEAKQVLDRFKSARYTGAYTLPDKKEELLQDIYRERRKEFVGELDICWLDMKRLGATAQRTLGGITYTLNGAGDYRYAFPIPRYEIEHNKEIYQNPGWIL